MVNLDEFKAYVERCGLEFLWIRRFKTHDRIRLRRRSTGITIELGLTTHIENIPFEDIETWNLGIFKGKEAEK